jgi:hypothetical protein
MIGLVVEPATVRRIKHVADPVIASGQLFGFASAGPNFPELDGTTRVGGIDKPATVRRPGTAVFVAWGRRELVALARDKIELE